MFKQLLMSFFILVFFSSFGYAESSFFSEDYQGLFIYPEQSLGKEVYPPSLEGTWEFDDSGILPQSASLKFEGGTVYLANSVDEPTFFPITIKKRFFLGDIFWVEAAADDIGIENLVFAIDYVAPIFSNTTAFASDSITEGRIGVGKVMLIRKVRPLEF